VPTVVPTSEDASPFVSGFQSYPSQIWLLQLWLQASRCERCFFRLKSALFLGLRLMVEQVFGETRSSGIYRKVWYKNKVRPTTRGNNQKKTVSAPNQSPPQETVGISVRGSCFALQLFVKISTIQLSSRLSSPID
jgi:hypothetical protein